MKKEPAIASWYRRLPRPIRVAGLVLACAVVASSLLTYSAVPPGATISGGEAGSDGSHDAGSAPPAPTPASGINVKDLGATGDGVTDDTAAIQRALDQGSATATPVHLPSGIYAISGRHGPLQGILRIASNTTLYGDGDGSVLKVANGMTAGGDYRIFVTPPDSPVTNIVFQRFRMDGNGQNNLQPVGGTIRRSYGVNVDSGSNVTIRDMLFENMPGPNVVVYGNNTSPASVRNGSIINSRFHNVGAGIPGNRGQYDHSTIYSQVDGGLIEGNKFWNDAPIDVDGPSTVFVTAMEVHGSHTLVQDNWVENYTQGGNAVSSVTDSIGNTWRNNTFHNIINIGLAIWSYTGFLHSDLTIANNSFHFSDVQRDGLHAGIYSSQLTSSTEVHNLRITGNLIYYEKAKPLGYLSYGIALSGVIGGTIADNTIKNWQADGVLLEPDPDHALIFDNIDIHGNTIRDVGLSSIGGRVWSIHLDNSIKGRLMSDIRIKGNVFIKVNAGLMQGIKVAGPGQNKAVEIEGNVFTNIPPSQRIVR